MAKQEPKGLVIFTFVVDKNTTEIFISNNVMGKDDLMLTYKALRTLEERIVQELATAQTEKLPAAKE